MKPRAPEYLALAAALVNAVLYSCALPLWEGFDEVVHYAYIETILVHHHFPVLNETRVSKEIRDSLSLTPLSNEQCESVPGSSSFEQWAGLSDGQKEERKTELREIPQSAREQMSEYKNYEAQQAPLAYMAYVPLDLMFAKLPLPGRILALRLSGTAVSCMLIYLGALRLLRELGVAPVFRPAMIATALASQMLWAAVAHVGNDALAVPLTVFFLGQLAAAVQDTSARNVLMLAAVLAFGLLTKAYFLAFVPVFLALLLIALRTRGIPWQLVLVALALVLLLAAPWYARNFALYSSISGTQQSVAGIGLRQAVSAFPQIDWIRSATEFSRWSLWTGNYSFLSFSKITLDIEIWLVRAGLLIYLVFWRSIQKAELWLWAACGCFGLSLVYQTCVTWVESHGLARFAEPWYGQGVIICVWALCFLAFGRWPSGGRWIAAVLVVVSAWIAAMTYLAKLLPYYAGGIKMGIASAVWKWWLSDPWTAIGGVTLAPAPVVRWLLIVFNVLLIAASVAVVRELLTGSHSRRSATK